MSLRAIGIFLLLLCSQRSEASAPAKFTAKFPHIESILSWNNSVWFSGTWYRKFLVVERTPAGQWITHSTAALFTEPEAIYQLGPLIYFRREDQVASFDRISNTWSVLKGTAPVDTNHQPSGDASYRIRDRIMTVVDRRDSNDYTFPLPSFNAYRRWYSNIEPGYYLQGGIDQNVLINGRIWFGIGFYAAEGTIGIGGLGVFDLKTREFGVLRHQLLSSSSTNLVTSYGDTIFIGTGENGEMEKDECSGLVLVDLRGRRIASVNQRNSALQGGIFTCMQRFGDWLWMSTEQVIVGWNLKTGSWNVARMDSVVTNDSTSLCRRIHYLVNPRDYASYACDSIVTVTRVKKGLSLGLLWADYQFARLNVGPNIFAEVSYQPGITGWLSRDVLLDRESIDKDMIAERPPISIYADSGMNVPLDCIKYSNLRRIASLGEKVKVSVQGLWCDTRSIEPQFHGEQGKAGFTPRWSQIGSGSVSVESLALSELRREQDEILNKIPVYDTTFVIRKGMDLYRSFHDLADLVWDPHDIPADSSPDGIGFFWRPPEGDIRVDLVCKDGKLKLNGKTYQSGEEWTEGTPSMKASLVFTDIKVGGKTQSVLESVKVKYRLWIYPVNN